MNKKMKQMALGVMFSLGVGMANVCAVNPSPSEIRALFQSAQTSEDVNVACEKARGVVKPVIVNGWEQDARKRVALLGNESRHALECAVATSSTDAHQASNSNTATDSIVVAKDTASMSNRTVSTPVIHNEVVDGRASLDLYAGAQNVAGVCASEVSRYLPSKKQATIGTASLATLGSLVYAYNKGFLTKEQGAMVFGLIKDLSLKAKNLAVAAFLKSKTLSGNAREFVVNNKKLVAGSSALALLGGAGYKYRDHVKAFGNMLTVWTKLLVEKLPSLSSERQAQLKKAMLVVGLGSGVVGTYVYRNALATLAYGVWSYVPSVKIAFPSFSGFTKMFTAYVPFWSRFAASESHAVNVDDLPIY